MAQVLGASLSAAAAAILLCGGAAQAFECQALVSSEYTHMQQQSKLSQEAGERAKALRVKAQEQKRSLSPGERDQAIQEIRQACSSTTLAYLSMRMLQWSLESPDCAKHPERGDAPKLNDPIKTMAQHLQTICGPQDWLR